MKKMTALPQLPFRRNDCFPDIFLEINMSMMITATKKIDPPPTAPAIIGISEIVLLLIFRFESSRLIAMLSSSCISVVASITNNFFR